MTLFVVELVTIAISLVGVALIGRAELARQAHQQGPVDGSKSATGPFYAGFGVAIMGSMFGWVPVAFHPWVRGMTQEWVCGPGATLLEVGTSNGNSASYGLQCSNGMSQSLFLHRLVSAGLLVACGLALSVLASLVIIMRRRGEKTREERAS